MLINDDVTTVGIDLGGTKLAAAPMKGSIFVESEIIKEATPSGTSEDIIDTMCKMVKKIQETHGIAAVGVSTAGMVNEKGEMIGSCGNIPSWKGTKVKKELEAKLSLPVIVENDANCSAYGEYAIGSGKDFKSMIMVTLGTGIGGGIIINDQIWRGAHFGGGEIGHLKLHSNRTRRCTCGSWDCWEAYASGTGLNNTARTYLADPNINNYSLMDKYNHGDADAIEVISVWHDHVAQGIASLINSFDPEAVVIGGGLAQFINYPNLNKKLKARVVDALKPYINVIEGKLANNSGMVGAACLANVELANLKMQVA
jgi:glucokinase